MKINPLWTKLFKRNNSADAVALYTRGATIKHRNPFETMAVPRNENELTKQFTNKWVVPFYSNSFSRCEEATIKDFAIAANEITIDIVIELLGDFNWRSRIVGAYFAAINNYVTLDDFIGRHLIKSEVCFAGFGYALALATFGTAASKYYLKTYLGYYLDQKDLWFDQADVYAALFYLDSNAVLEFEEKWLEFIIDKPHSRSPKTNPHFFESLKAIDLIRQATKSV